MSRPAGNPPRGLAFRSAKLRVASLKTFSACGAAACWPPLCVWPASAPGACPASSGAQPRPLVAVAAARRPPPSAGAAPPRPSVPHSEPRSNQPGNTMPPTAPARASQALRALAGSLSAWCVHGLRAAPSSPPAAAPRPLALRARGSLGGSATAGPCAACGGAFSGPGPAVERSVRCGARNSSTHFV